MLHKSWKREMPLYLMLIPGIILVFIYSYIPMAGLVMAFQKFNPAKGYFRSEWVGLDNFKNLISNPDIWGVLRNTVFIAFMKIILGLIVPLVFALLLNELRSKISKNTIQTMVYFPHFLSWVILGGVLIDILSPSSGIVNQILGYIGLPNVFFLGNARVFPYVIVVSDVWKEFGFNAIIYIAALTKIDPTLYEASTIDGCNRWKQTKHITLPAITGIVVLMTTLNMGNVLNAGFEQVYNLYSPVVYSTGDIIDTMVFRLGLLDTQYSLATAVGLFKSVVSFIFISTSYFLAHRYADYRIF